MTIKISRPFFLLSLVLFLIKVEGSEKERTDCIEKLKLCFELQSKAKSYLDSYNNCVLYNETEAHLKRLKEPEDKLEAVRNLWLWYRMYGYSCGLLLNPVYSPDEYIPYKMISCSIKSFRNDSSKDAYNSAEAKQKRCLREFLLGVGMTISGVFCLTVNPPVGGPFGRPLILGGFGYIWNSMNTLIVDEQEKTARLHELESLQKQTEATLETKKK